MMSEEFDGMQNLLCTTKKSSGLSSPSSPWDIANADKNEELTTFPARIEHHFEE
jgi:hypothetical protein